MLEFQVSAILKKVFIVVKKKYDKNFINIIVTDKQTHTSKTVYPLSFWAGV